MSPDQDDVQAEATLDFRSAIWLVGGAILISQVYGFAISAGYEFGGRVPSSSYHLYSELGSAIWYVVFFLVVVVDIKHQGVSPSALFNLDLAHLVEGKRVLCYFLGCVAVVLGLTALIGGDELGLDSHTEEVQALTFLVTVVVSPIVEEMIFRGYLYFEMIPAFKREKERMVVNAILFAGAHVFLAAFLLGALVPYYIFVLGFLLARLYDKSGSILSCIALHGLNNGLVYIIEFANLKIDPG